MEDWNLLNYMLSTMCRLLEPYAPTSLMQQVKRRCKSVTRRLLDAKPPLCLDLKFGCSVAPALFGLHTHCLSLTLASKRLTRGLASSSPLLVLLLLFLPGLDSGLGRSFVFDRLGRNGTGEEGLDERNCGHQHLLTPA